MKILAIATLLLTFSTSLNAIEDDDNASAIISPEAAKLLEQPWGSLHTFFTGKTYSTKDVLAAVVVINPGMENHPPHTHSEEEYMMLLEGEGVWHLNGKDIKASVGDMLYAKPWDIHGLNNTGKTPLKFVVWKWHAKGQAAMKEPK